MSADCDMEECWYEHNRDRMDEYCADDNVLCVANVDYDSESLNDEGLDMYKGAAPQTFTLCSVCWENAGFKNHGLCIECRRVMVDKGLTIGGRLYCRDCRSLDKLMGMVEEHVDDFPKEAEEWDDAWEPVTWDLLRTSVVHPMIAMAIRKADTTHLQKRYKAATLRRQRVKRKVEQEIHRLAPDATQSTCKRVRRAFHIKKSPESLDQLFLMMAQRHEPCGIHV